MAYDKAADAARLKDIFVRTIQAKGESREHFGRRSGLGKAANVSHYLNGRNALDVDTARRFAMYMGCAIEDFSPHWARIAHATGQFAHVEAGNPHVYGGSAPTAQENTPHWGNPKPPQSDTTNRIPLLSWGRIELMSELNESLFGSEGVEFVEADTEQVGPRTKYVDMPDGSMTPRIHPGDRLTIEPDWSPEPGEVALLRDKHGAYHVRIYKQIRPGHFIATPYNDTDYAALDSIAEGLETVGVVVARREFMAKRRRS